jgi:1-pyrroline-5-carboxylate dehydrogenase
MMRFENEDTFRKLLGSNKESVFHQKYEEEIRRVRSQFGKRYPLLINGKEIRSTNSYKHTSPLDTRIILGYFPRANLKQVSSAIESASETFQIWRTKDLQERLKIFSFAAEKIVEKKFELSAWITFENGKNRFEAMSDVDEAIDFIRYYSADIVSNKGYVTDRKSVRPSERTKSVMKPYGVWGVISPFNFPAALTIGMCTGALVTGNTVVLKPSSDTPIVAYLFCEIMMKAGLPTGALNLITGSGNTVGNAIVQSRRVAGIAFTGSKAVGDLILDESNKMKSRVVIAELGGKNPVVVTPTADLDDAVEGIIQGAFGYSGQKCSASSRVYVHKDVKKDFVEQLTRRTKELFIGNPIEAKTFMGPLINSGAYLKYQEYSKFASRYGKVLVGGKIRKYGELKHGFFVEPVIVEGLSRENFLLKEELFLPILCVKEYTELKEALNQCNDSVYGLAAGIYSNSKREIETFLEEIQAGVVYVNRSSGATTGAMVGCQSFGGWKASGTTGKGTGGSYYLPQFLKEQSQTIVSKGIKHKKKAKQFSGMRVS